MRTAKIGPDLRLENDRKSIATLSGVCSCLGDSENNFKVNGFSCVLFFVSNIMQIPNSFVSNQCAVQTATFYW